MLDALFSDGKVAVLFLGEQKITFICLAPIIKRKTKTVHLLAVHTTHSSPFFNSASRRSPYPRPYRTNGSAYINIDRKCESQKQYPIFGNSDAAAEAEWKNRKEEWQMNE